MQVHTWEMNIAALKSASDRNVQNMVTVPAAQQRKVAKIKMPSPIMIIGLRNAHSENGAIIGAPTVSNTAMNNLTIGGFCGHFRQAMMSSLQ